MADIERGLSVFLGSASWAHDGDGISFGGVRNGTAFTALITRDGLATLVGKDRCEVSAAAAWEIFTALSERVISIVANELGEGLKSFILIGYDEVERCP